MLPHDSSDCFGFKPSVLAEVLCCSQATRCQMVQEYAENDALKETQVQPAADSGIWHYNSAPPHQCLRYPTDYNLFMFSNSLDQAWSQAACSAS